MYKQVIVVRKDLKMSPGKTASQVAHASVSAIDNAEKGVVEKWKKEGQKKIVLKVEDLKELIIIKNLCRKMRMPYAVVSDAGHTELKPGTITALAIGPDKEENIDKLTGNLKIL